MTSYLGMRRATVEQPTKSRGGMSVPPVITSSSSSSAPPSSPPAPQSQRGFVEDIVLNIFEPGANRSVLIFLNLTFVLLLLTLVGLTALVGPDLHILFLIALAVGLMAGFNW